MGRRDAALSGMQGSASRSTIKGASVHGRFVMVALVASEQPQCCLLIVIRRLLMREMDGATRS